MKLLNLNPAKRTSLATTAVLAAGILSLRQVSPFQVTLLQVAELQWVATGAVLGLIASNSGLSLAPYSRPACGVLTIDTRARPPELVEAFVVARSGPRASVLNGP